MFVIFPLVIHSLINKHKRNFEEQQGRMYRDDFDSSKIGETIIHKNRNASSSKSDDGEYVDFEEIK